MNCPRPRCGPEGSGGGLLERIGEWTKRRGNSPRLYPGSLVWCACKPGKELRRKAELWLAWQRVAKELADGVLGAEYDRSDRAEVQAQAKAAQEAAAEEVWASYRFIALSDHQEEHGLKVIDLGAGHSSGSETLAGRVIGALKAEALLNESVGAGYLERHWPPAFKDSGAWPLTSLRRSFLDGSLTRLSDPDAVLRRQIVEFVGRGDFGLASRPLPSGGFERLWHGEAVQPEEVAFEKNVFLLAKAQAEKLRSPPEQPPPTQPPIPEPTPKPTPSPTAAPSPEPSGGAAKTTLRLTGTIPPEVWNRLGTKVLPKLRSGQDLQIGIDFSVSVDANFAPSMVAELEQTLADLEVSHLVSVRQQ